MQWFSCPHGHPKGAESSDAAGEKLQTPIGSRVKSCMVCAVREIAERLPRNCSRRRVGNVGRKDLARHTVDEFESEGRSPVAKSSERARALLGLVGVGTEVAVGEVALQGAINEDGELAGGRGDGLRFPDASRQ